MAGLKKKAVDFAKLTDAKMAEQALADYRRLADEVKERNEALESLKAAIYDYMDENKADEFTAGSNTATRTYATRDTLLADAIERKFGISLTPDCYKSTTYAKLSVKPNG